MSNKYTDGEYLAKNPQWHVADSAWKASKIFQILKHNQITPKTIVEIGCGAGEILNCLYQNFPNSELHGYDISPQAHQFAVSRQKDRLSFHLGDIFDDNQKYDLALAIDVFEYVENHFSFLRNIQQKANHHVFHIPLDLSAQAVLRGTPLMLARQSVGHLHYFTKDTAFATLHETGFEIQDWFYTAGSLELPAKSMKTWIAKTPRALGFKFFPDLTVRTLGGFSIMVLTKSASFFK